MKKLFIIFAVLCLAAPAMAADWNFYGSARMRTFYIDVDPDAAGVDSDKDLQWNQQGNSRIGANVKFNDEIGGGFEMSDSFGKRKLFGTYNFGSSQILLGQTYAPSAIFASNSVFDGDGDLLGVGEFYEGRVPMIQWKMAGFKIALIQPATATSNATTDIDTTIPKIEGSYKYSADMFWVQVFAGYNSFTDERSTVPGGIDVDYDSYVAGLGGGMTFGPAFLKLGVHMGQNLGNYGSYQPYINDEAAIDAAGNVRDNDALGYMAVLGFNASEMFVIEAGFGFDQAEVDGANDADEVMQYYLNTTINITKGFFIVPEVGMIKRSPPEVVGATTSEPETFYFGAKWQINF